MWIPPAASSHFRSDEGIVRNRMAGQTCVVRMALNVRLGSPGLCSIEFSTTNVVVTRRVARVFSKGHVFTINSCTVFLQFLIPRAPMILNEFD